MHLVQLTNGTERLVAAVEGDKLREVAGHGSAYELAMAAIAAGLRIPEVVRRARAGREIDYDAVYQRRSDWRLLPSFDHPHDAAHLTVSGTGLTHKASAENRAAMHKNESVTVTDSMRMYEMGKQGGRPDAGAIGVQPEWFYKGDGSIVRAHGDALEVPAFAEDGGEEPEIAGVYVIGDDGTPYRVGLTVGNEFADHVMERRNYLYLAPSKLRSCALGPELWVDCDDFDDVPGTVAVERAGKVLWQAKILSGERNMCHSIANLEHHHFKYELHRRPAAAHVHFFGADAFSFGEGVQLEDGDVMAIQFEGFGRALRNPLRVVPRGEQAVKVKALG